MVEITYGGENIKVSGEVFIVDAYGTFEQNEEPSYDIMITLPDVTDRCLLKHIRESSLLRYNEVL